MILESGLILGDYQIIDLVGEGAMGKVYRARDRMLGRDVALKVLSSDFSRREEQLARFQREARVLASLNHPNIAIIHGLGQVEETCFIVLELIEGETLAQVISRGRLSVRQALELGRQLADALEAAHARGIVHRDLKPANVKLTDGKVKVLDFGIAKSFRDDFQSTESVAELGDLSTQSGVVLGTIGYMSPEQVRGESIDGRSDIWAFGCLLFELLTNQRAFRGKTPSDTVVLVLEREPPWKALPPGVPASIELLLQRCLRRDRSRRLQAIGDARIEIEDALEGELPVRDGPAPSRFSGRVLAAVVSLLIGAAAGFLAARDLSLFRPPDGTGPIDGRASRFSFSVPEEQTLPYLGQSSLAISRDSSRLAYVVLEPDGETQIYQRPLDRLESSSIPDTRGARGPFFSPDGKWLGFVASAGEAHRLHRRSFDGGVPVVFHEESRPPLGGAVWSDDGDVFFAAADGLRLISANGGAPRVVACGGAIGTVELCRWPDMLPGGNAIVYTVTSAGGESPSSRIVTASIVTGERRTLVEGASAARFSKTGHLVYAQDGGIFAAPFDVEKLGFTSPPTRLASDVLMDPATGSAQFAISAEGTLAYVSNTPGEVVRRLILLGEGGRASWAREVPWRSRGAFRISPDGRTVALTLEHLDGTDIWLFELSTGDLRRLTHGGESDAPVWSPDGSRLAFRARRSGHPVFFSMEVDGRSSEDLLFDGDELHEPSSWERGLLAFTARAPEGGLDIWALDTARGTAKPVVTATANEMDPAYSEGRIAYVSNATGRTEVYVIPSEGPGSAVQVSDGGGLGPRWSRDGRKLFYRYEGGLFSVEIGKDAETRIGTPTLVGRTEPGAPFDVLPGGGFLVLEERAPARQIVVVKNFLAELPKAP